MIATVSPGASSTDHSLNTLRYADRIKEQRTNTPTGAGAASKRRTSNATAASKSPRPPPPPTQQRLQRIANASKLAQERRQEAGEDVLALENKTLGPTGLVETLKQNSPGPAAFIDDYDDEDEDDDDELLLADSGGGMSRNEEPEVVDDAEEDGDKEEDDDDEDYVPSESDDDDENFYTPTASEDIDESDFWQKDEEEQQLIDEAITMEDEEEMRRIVQGLFELEEALLNQHMSNIQQHAEMLTQEGKLLQTIHPSENTIMSSEEEMDDYAIQLAEYLDRKEIMIYKLQQKLGDFKQQLAKEQEMSERVQKLSQY